MHDMESVSVRELQKNMKAILARVENGETIEVTRRREVVGRLSPVRQRRRRPAAWPDLDARARKVFGDRVVEPSPSAEVADDRGPW